MDEASRPHLYRRSGADETFEWIHCKIVQFLLVAVSSLPYQTPQGCCDLKRLETLIRRRRRLIPENSNSPQ
ncbi:MAG: hypothetical protein ACRCXD_08180, partial [Luteolibacter sp.]